MTVFSTYQHSSVNIASTMQWTSIGPHIIRMGFGDYRWLASQDNERPTRVVRFYLQFNNINKPLVVGFRLICIAIVLPHNKKLSLHIISAIDRSSTYNYRLSFFRLVYLSFSHHPSTHPSAPTYPRLRTTLHPHSYAGTNYVCISLNH